MNNIIPEFTPDQPWRAEVVEAIDDVKKNGGQWIVSTTPALFKTATQVTIDFANSFESFATQFAQRQAKGNVAGALRIARSALTNLQEQAKTAETALRDLVVRQKALSREMSRLRTKVTKAQTEAKAKHAAESAEINALGTALRKIEAEALSAGDRFREAAPATNLGAAGSLIKNVAWSGGGTMAVNVAGKFWKLGQISTAALKTGSVIKGAPVAMLIAAGMMIYQQYTTNKLYDEYTGKIREIIKQIESLSKVSQALIVTQMVAFSLGELLEACNAPGQIGDSIVHAWENMEEKLSTALAALSAPDADITKIAALRDLSSSAAVWSRLSRQAQLTQQSLLADVPIPMEEFDLKAPLAVVGGAR